MIKSARSSDTGNASKRKPGRFNNIVKRVKARRRASTPAGEGAAMTRDRDNRRNSSASEDGFYRPRPAHEVILKKGQLDSPTSVMTCDVLGRESISTLDTERDEDYCESEVDATEEEQLQQQQLVVAATRTSVEFISRPANTAQAVSLSTWFHDVDALLHSREMSALVSSTGAIVLSATKTAVHVATLPVTLPLHVASSTTSMVIGTCAFALDVLCSTVDRAIVHRSTTEQEQDEQDASSSVESNLVQSAVPFLFGAVGKLKDEIGSTLLGLVADPTRTPMAITETSQQQQHVATPCRRNRRLLCNANNGYAGDDSSLQDDDEFLERLRLHPTPPRKKKQSVSNDVQVEKTLASSPNEVSKPERQTQASLEHPSQPSSSNVSKFLLRVCDLELFVDEDDDNNTDYTKQARKEKVYHIDLSEEYYDKTLTMQALDALVNNGLALLASCPDAKFTNGTTTTTPSSSPSTTSQSPTLVKWKPEGSTEKLLRKKTKMSTSDWITLMGKEVLVWSGKLCARTVHKADVPVFLSRGMVPLSPKAMLQLFWDDSRTKSYNKFSLGRSTSMELQDESCTAAATTATQNSRENAARKTKVVQSETQVPFTGFSVVMSTLMHARHMHDPEECYVIVSRSLSPGVAGVHVGSPPSFTEETKNELLWGVNVLRHVPGRPDLTDLTSISQVSSSLVVHFLAHRVGIMAVESCYSAMRSA